MEDKTSLMTFVKPIYIWTGIKYFIQALGWGMVALLGVTLLFGTAETIAMIPALLVYTLTPGICVLWIIHLAKNWSK